MSRPAAGHEPDNPLDSEHQEIHQLCLANPTSAVAKNPESQYMILAGTLHKQLGLGSRSVDVITPRSPRYLPHNLRMDRGLRFLHTDANAYCETRNTGKPCVNTSLQPLSGPPRKTSEPPKRKKQQNFLVHIYPHPCQPPLYQSLKPLTNPIENPEYLANPQTTS